VIRPALYDSIHTFSPACLMRWVCLRCSAVYDERPAACGACFRHDLLVPQPATLRGREVTVAPRRRAGVVAATKLRPDPSLAWYSDPWRLAWAIGRRHAILLLGPPGGGKSTLATQLAVSAARQTSVLYLAAEEGHSAALASRLERAGLDDMVGHRLQVSDARDLIEIGDDLAGSPAELVVLDSLSELRMSPATLAEVLLGRSWIGIAHVNARGGALGGHEFGHAADVVVRVEDGLATPAKNRWGGMAPVRVWPEEVSNERA
jgi:hypothetical protein